MKKLTEKEIELIAKLVKDVKSICVDRMDAITADGVQLDEAFKKLEELLSE